MLQRIKRIVAKVYLGDEKRVYSSLRGSSTRALSVMPYRAWRMVGRNRINGRITSCKSIPWQG